MTDGTCQKVTCISSLLQVISVFSVMQQLMARANKNMTKISHLPLTRAYRQIDRQRDIQQDQLADRQSVGQTVR